ncbi:hypothetical protein M1B72_20865 [Geomonas paludis]|uniref:Peptidase C51 domain-containing protein n=1 Tax=Geomonas paludis TaxID=2740185 RepID=A0A6V8MRN2_9BACT|nr:hypothetical protein [Geomonas paludis]UPU35862.1 hypothetical protein M1B72_20865 [Geomonas paludis]GFO62554.1 hypothetical protein GMPD_04730 [Geomonas paludis]
MKRFPFILLIIAVLGMDRRAHADTCNCDDWIQRGGYCVDYIKERIPSFPIPYKSDMPHLKNADVADVTEGDVAVFALRNYWHVAYVEKVHRDERGQATAIDVSEMNFGGDLSFAEFKAKWRSDNLLQWQRATCCGITDTYDQTTLRSNVDLDTVTQIWSPDDAAPGGSGRRDLKALTERVREVISRFREFIQSEL